MPKLHAKAIPMVCVVCKHTPGAYYGRLVFPQELELDPSVFDVVAEAGGVVTEKPVPECPNHTGSDLKYPLTPVNRTIVRSVL